MMDAQRDLQVALVALSPDRKTLAAAMAGGTLPAYASSLLGQATSALQQFCRNSTVLRLTGYRVEAGVMSAMRDSKEEDWKESKANKSKKKGYYRGKSRKW